ncbi:MAG: hypothetical protein J0L87_12480 [Bacteroidetes bacterium]|nr:hypothetical protein [Bacteroidota bacterium]
MTKYLLLILLSLETLSCCYGQSTLANALKSKKHIASNNVSIKDTAKANKSIFLDLDKNAILQDSISNVIGGIIFALIIFGLNEYFFRQKNLTGEWLLRNKTIKTSYNPHKNLSIEYKVHLLQFGTEITGRGEKTKDINADGTIHHEYPPEKRVEIEIEGHYKRNFLRRSKLYLLIRENGTKRTSSTSIELTIPIFKAQKIIGNFISTASNSSGTSNWTKSS